MTDSEEYSKDLESEMHRTIKKVSSDIEQLGFNTAIAAMMSLVNKFYSKGSITKGELRTFLKLVNPFAPHISEEIQQVLGFGEELAYSKWPEYDEAKCVDQTIEIAVQINGKVRSRMTVKIDADKDQVLADAKADEKIAEFLTGKQIVKEIYIPGKIVNIVAK